MKETTIKDGNPTVHSSHQVIDTRNITRLYNGKHLAAIKNETYVLATSCLTF
jgi:hypothetical protein